MLNVQLASYVTRVSSKLKKAGKSVCDYKKTDDINLVIAGVRPAVPIGH